MRTRLARAWVVVFAWLVIAALPAAVPAQGEGRASAPEKSAAGEAAMPAGNRLGIVVLQFDDGWAEHYSNAFRILEKHKLKGSFGVVTGALGQPGRLTGEQIAEMSRAGHEIHDHTLDHNPAFWGNPQNRAQWKVQIEQSLGILKKWGIQTRGWNQPGGGGAAWSPELRETLAPCYDYVAGRVKLTLAQNCNMHWNLKDDPFCLGYGGVKEMNRTGGKEQAAKDAARAATQIADGVQQGLVTIPLWHEITAKSGWDTELEEMCKFLTANKLQVMVMADAVKAVQNTRKRFAPQVEQMPNPDFASDIDRNDRPDGYSNCRYAPAEIKSPEGGRVAEFGEGTSTWIYGPEAGSAQLALTMRSADGVARTITPVLTFAEINAAHEYRWREKERCQSIPAGVEWKTGAVPVTVGKDVDRVRIEFAIAPPGKVYVAKANWKLVK